MTPLSLDVVLLNQLRHFGPLVFAVLGCLLTGSLINQTPNIENDSVQLDKDFKCKKNNDTISDTNNTSVLSSSSSNWTTNFIIIFAIILPLIPLVLFKNKKNKNANFQNTNAFLSHLLGQSLIFAGNEFIKHFLISPDTSFFAKCNSTVELCLQKRLQRVALFLATAKSSKTNNQMYPNQTIAFCSNSTLPVSEIFASLHSMPNIVFSMLGASAILFLANIYLWKQNKNANNSSTNSIIDKDKDKDDNNVEVNVVQFNNIFQKFISAFQINNYNLSKKISHVKVLFVLIFCLFISSAFIYKKTQSLNDNFELFTSFLYGAGLQLFIFALFQWQYYDNKSKNINVELLNLSQKTPLKIF